MIDNHTLGLLGFCVGSFLIGYMIGSNSSPPDNRNTHGGYTPKEFKSSYNPKKKLRDKNNEYKIPKIKPGTRI